MRRILPFVAGAVVLVLAAAVAAVLLGAGSSKRLTAYFPATIGIYKNSSVRILGVPVGSVDSVTPEGTQVRVVISYDSKYRLPANVDAVVVNPSIVSDRYVQLAPVFTGGSVLADNAVLPTSRTEVPVELDQIFASINQLNVALGPNGANSKGALSQLIKVGAANLGGNGQQLHDTLQAFSQAIATLGGHRGDLFATLSNLQQFTSTLAHDDGGVRTLNADLAAVSTQLNGERADLGSALANLAVALGEVQRFVKDNRGTFTNDVSKLTTITSGLVREKRAITEVLDDAPTALANLSLTYDQKTRSLRTRDSPLTGLQTDGLLGLLTGGESGGLCGVLNTLPNLPGAPNLPCPAPSATSVTAPPHGSAPPSAAQALTELLGVTR